MTFLKGLREHSPGFGGKSRQVHSVLLRTVEVLEAKFKVSTSHVCRVHDDGNLDGNLAYLQLV